MRDRIKNHIIFSTTLILFAVILGVAAWYVNFSQHKIENALQKLIQEKSQTLINLSEITDRNGADDVISQIISDCSRRNEFETQLNNLASLDERELLSLQNLIEACGGFYAERKALMVSKLEQEFLSYSEIVELSLLLSDHQAHLYHVDTWNELVDLEKTRSTLLVEQKVIQEKIISNMIQGLSIHSPEVKKLVSDAQEIEVFLTVYGKKIDEIRQSLKGE